MKNNKIKRLAAFRKKAQGIKERNDFGKMYVSERIVNIGELEDKLHQAHGLASLLKSKIESIESKECYVVSCELVNILSDACNFEFEIEVRNTFS